MSSYLLHNDHMPGSVHLLQPQQRTGYRSTAGAPPSPRQKGRSWQIKEPGRYCRTGEREGECSGLLQFYFAIFKLAWQGTVQLGGCFCTCWRAASCLPLLGAGLKGLRLPAPPPGRAAGNCLFMSLGFTNLKTPPAPLSLSLSSGPTLRSVYSQALLTGALTWAGRPLPQGEKFPDPGRDQGVEELRC